MASLRDEDIEFLCHGSLQSAVADASSDGQASSGGQSVRSGGLVSCLVGYEPTSKDIKMVTMEKNKAKAEKRAPCYEDWPCHVDFHFRRDDGVVFTLHPSHTGKNVSVKAVTPNMVPAPAPKAGMYNTDGPGTFRRVADCNILMDTRLDLAELAAVRSSGRPQCSTGGSQ